VDIDYLEEGMQAGERNIQLYNRLGNRQPYVPPYGGSRRVINRQFTHRQWNASHMSE
jgi:hypothetical protein